MTWRLSGTHLLDTWLEGQHAELRMRVLTFLHGLCAEPTRAARGAVRADRPAPIFFDFVPDTDVVVTYLIAEQFQVIHLLQIERLSELT